jgi:hypothetical protein
MRGHSSCKVYGNIQEGKVFEEKLKALDNRMYMK